MPTTRGSGHERSGGGWYCYLENQLQFPFTAVCVARRPLSPLHVKDEVEVIGMPGESECQDEMFVTIRWEKEGLAVPLSQLKPVHAEEEAVQAVEDWHYGVARGCEFGGSCRAACFVFSRVMLGPAAVSRRGSPVGLSHQVAAADNQSPGTLGKILPYNWPS